MVHLVGQLSLGGMESMVVLQAAHLDPRAFHVEVWSLSGRGDENAARLDAAGVPVRSLGKKHGFDGEFLPRFRALLRGQSIDVLHAHNAPAARWAIAGVMGMHPRPAIVKTEHTYDRMKAAAYLIGHALKGPWFDALIGVSEDTTHRHRRVDPIWRSRYLTVVNGIDLVGARTDPMPDPARRTELGLPAAGRLLMNLGNLRPPKGQRYLLESFASLASRFQDLRLAIVGEGKLRAEFESFIASKSLASRVHLVGHRSDAARLLAAADVVVQSSVREGLPVSLLEAARVSRPIVATDVGGTRELVRDGQTGRLVRSRDAGALASAIAATLESPDEAHRWARAAHRRLVEEFGVGQSAQRLGDLYRRLTEPKRGLIP